MTTIREPGERGIILRSLREGIDTSSASGRMVAGVLASLAELELELGSRTSFGSAGRSAGAWAISWSPEGSRRLQDGVGAADARQW